MKKNKYFIVIALVIVCIIAISIPFKYVWATENKGDNSSNKNVINLNIAEEETLKKCQKGDLDGNGEIDSYDSLIILEYVVNVASGKDVSKYSYAVKALDITGDNKITTNDAQVILQYVVRDSEDEKLSLEEFAKKWCEM